MAAHLLLPLPAEGLGCTLQSMVRWEGQAPGPCLGRSLSPLLWLGFFMTKLLEA